MQIRLTFVLLLIVNLTYAQQNFVFSGKISDERTNVPLPGANVYIEDISQGKATDNEGDFSIELKKGSYTAIISFIGYLNDTFNINISKDLYLEIKLKPSEIQLDEVKFYGNRNKNVEAVSSGTVKMKRREILELPTFLGENDPIKVLQLTPGVQGAKEGFSGLYIRGGSPDQNLISVDGATVYNPSHLYGFFSVFNPDIIDHVTLIKSGMNATYGGRLASVLEIKTRDGDFYKYKANGALGILASRLSVEGPVVKEKVSLMLSARRTYIYEMLQVLKKPLHIKSKSLRFTNYHFLDLNGKLSYKINPKNKLSITYYSGGDVFLYGGESFGFNTSMDWSNELMALNYDHIFNQQFFLKNTLSYTNYSYNFSGSFLEYYFNMSSYINNYNYKSVFNWLLENSVFAFGWEANKYHFKPTGQSIELENYKRELIAENIYYSFDIAGFINTEFERDRFKVNTGIRYVRYFQTGPVYEWEVTEEGLLEDSLVNNKGDIIAQYPGLEPRLSVRYLLNGHSSLKASFNYNNQFVHIAPVSAVSLPTDVWVPSTKSIPPQKGYQAAVGYYHNLQDNLYEISIETYYKNLQNLIEFKSSAVDIYNKTFEEKLEFGDGLSTGVELFIKKTDGVYTGWLGYTWSYTTRNFEALNNGKPFFAKYDRRHDLSWVNSIKINPKWQCSFLFVYATGNAYTMPQYRYLIDGKIVNGYSGINTFRMPSYHRADISFTRSYSKKWYDAELNFSVYNLYNHKNPYYIVFNTEGSVEENKLEVKPEFVTLYALLPSVSIKFNFK